MRNSALRRTTPLFLVAIFCLAVLSVWIWTPGSDAKPVSSPNGKRASKVNRHDFVPGDVLVRYRSETVAKRQGPSATLLSATGRAITARIERFEGSDLIPGLRIAKVAPAETLEAVAALQSQPNVLYAEPNYILRADLTPNDPQFAGLFGLTKINAPLAWDTETGNASVVIGVIDQGIDLNHPDLTANRWINPAPGSIPGFSGDVNGYNFVNNNGTVFSGDPNEDHATHVAGIAGARGNNAIGVVGVNWTVSLMSLKFLEEDGGGSTANAVRAVNYAKAMRDLFVSSGGTQGANVRVLNNSYGGGAFSLTFANAVNAINGSGILFVAAAGNFPDDPEPDNDIVPHYPANIIAPNVISVANTTSADGLSGGSHFGKNSVHLGAPGTGIISTVPGNTYASFSGTSMATPHVAGAAALLWAENPNLTVKQVKDLLLFNGDVVPALVDKTITGRRLNVGRSMQSLLENDTTPPGIVTNLHVNTIAGRTINIGWTASGDDGAAGPAAAHYQITFTDGLTGEVLPLTSLAPAAPGTGQTTNVKLPFRHTRGTINVRVFDNVGNEGPTANLPVQISFSDGDPYATTLSVVVPLSTGGTRLFGQPGDDDKYADFTLPFAFPYFGTNFTTLKISTNGNLFFSTPPTRSNGDADDVPSLIVDLERHKMISGLWDDINLATGEPNTRADAGVYVVNPGGGRIIFRWQGVPCGFNGSICTGGAPVNFEIELNSDGTIKSRYGSGNTDLFPVVGISGGEPEAYVIPSHTSEFAPFDLTNAVEVTYIPRNLINPLENNYFFVSQNYRDFLGREPDLGGLAYWAGQINDCNQTADPAACKNQRRVGVSAAFFTELEFQRTGSFVYRLYKGGLARRPTFAEFNADRVLVVEGPNLEATKNALALAFVQRPEFVAKYNGQNNADAFVNALIASILAEAQIDLNSLRTEIINRYNAGANQNESRAFALRHAIDSQPFTNGEFNRAFVLMEYFGYLHRDPDAGGYAFWLDVVNNRATNNYRAMVCAFITSAEYQQLFSALTPRQNTDCANIN